MISIFVLLLFISGICFRKYYFTLFCDYVSKILTGAAVRRCLTNFPKMFTKFTRKYCNEVLLATTTLTIQDSMSVVFSKQLFCRTPEAYSEPCQTSKMERFTKIVKAFCHSLFSQNAPS